MNNTPLVAVKTTPWWQLLLFWLWVLMPLSWGVSATLKKALALFA